MSKALQLFGFPAFCGNFRASLEVAFALKSFETIYASFAFFFAFFARTVDRF
jgi:hypothetical protein